MIAVREDSISLPDGMLDRIFVECSQARQKQALAASLFEEHGYREVSTPVLEHYGLFIRTGSPLPEEEMFKVIDRSGKICVLRPDSTTPIARLASARLSGLDLPLKLWYMQPVFRSDKAHAGNRTQIMQAGIEHIGESGAAVDASILKLAVKVMEKFGCDYHIELSHAGIFQALCGEMGNNEREIIRSLIERKNFAALGDELGTMSNNTVAHDLKLLTRLSGDFDILEEALACKTSALKEPLSELQALCAMLPEVRFSIDFGLLQPIEYYTGVIFKGYVSGAASAVLVGGRYDKLLAHFGWDVPAVGFAIDMDVIA